VHPPETTSAKAAALLRRLGLGGAVLLAALVCDLLIVIPAAFDDVGPRGRDLLMLPGILAMTACALWARSRPAVAAFAGAGVLVVSTLLLRTFHAEPYSPLLTNVSVAETVAGFELVYYCVRHVRWGIAFAGVSSLIVGCLIAVTGRSARAEFITRDFLLSAGFGSILLVVAVVAGLVQRHPHPKKPDSWAMKMLREQWPIIGLLSLLLFFELVSTAETGIRAIPMLACSVAAATLAVLAARAPVQITLMLAGIYLFSGLVESTLNVGPSYPVIGGLTLTQILCGMIVVVVLVRTVEVRPAWISIGALSGVVALVTLVTYHKADSAMAQLVIAALLLLGLAVAIGLFLRSRDSERKQVVHSAVTEAQTSERMALARELHDVVAHHVTGIVVLAQAAKLSAETNPKIAAEVLGRIDVAGTEALAAMRRLVRSMRGDAPSGSSDFSAQATTDLAADLRKLVDGANHGVSTTVQLELPPHLPQEVGRSALRLVQESLTNVGKHAAGAREAKVLVEVAEGELHLRVSDDGKEQDCHPAGGGIELASRSDSVEGGGGRREGGYGLVGMRERVELLHGRLFAGRGPDGGWRVEAWLPLEGDS
jgi:signal transduction histidine kinase